MKKAKWLSEEALQIAMKRREVKGKGEKERYTHLNAEFQRIARRHKKAFLSNQCKEIEENNRMGKTRELFKKIRDTKGTLHAKMSPVKDRNGMDHLVMSMCRVSSCFWKRVFSMTSAFSWQNSVSLCLASLRTSRPNLPFIPGILTFTFASQSL